MTDSETPSGDRTAVAGAMAVILAAGIGSRLQPLTNDRPKCLVEVAGRPILLHALDRLAEAGVDECIVVAGYRADLVRDAVADGPRTLTTRVVIAPDFARTGTAASLAVGLNAIDGEADLVVIEGDVIFDREVIVRLARSSRPATAVAGGTPNCSGTFFAVQPGGLVAAVHHAAWEPPASDAVLGKCVNVHVFDRSDLGDIADALDSVLAQDPTAQVEHVLQRLLDCGFALHAVEVGDVRWWEVDDSDDLAIARSMFASDRQSSNASTSDDSTIAQRR